MRLEQAAAADTSPQDAAVGQAEGGQWRYLASDGEWQWVPDDKDANERSQVADVLDLPELLSQSHLAQRRTEGLRKLDSLTHAYKTELIKMIMDVEALRIDNQVIPKPSSPPGLLDLAEGIRNAWQDYLDGKKAELETLTVDDVRQEAVERDLDPESVNWLRGRIGELVPTLVELLRDLPDGKERVRALSTVKHIVR